VENSHGILYRVLPGYPLSARGKEMARLVAETLSGEDIACVVASPMGRAVQTAEPLASRCGLTVQIDHRLVEPISVFQGPLGSRAAAL
jgi:broad specificity phosphatase PhoE